MPLRPVPYSPTVGNLIRDAGRRFTDRDFVVCEASRLTFAAAEEQSRYLAKRMLEAGVGKGTRVGMLFPQGPAFAMTFLAITRIGGLAVPLSTFLRPPELRRAVRHGDLHVLIAPRSLSGQDTEVLFDECWSELGHSSGPRLHLTEAPYLRQIWLVGEAEQPWVTPVPALIDAATSSEISDDLLEQVESEVRPSDLMVMIHTSGATAEPKAVVHTHGAQIRHAWTLAQLYALAGDTRTFTTMPFFWVGGLTVTLLTHLHVGATVITVEKVDPKGMLASIKRERATRLVGWTLLDRILSEPTFSNRDLSWLNQLDPSASVSDPGLRHNSLGMSETSGPHTAAAAIDNERELPENWRGSFGPPVPGMQHKIVDLTDSSVEMTDGSEGEILVRGYSLMDGLYKKERADTFDDNGWYQTGDKGYFRDSLLFFTGRTSEMIKTGGANVAPREVEAALESLSGVRTAFVVGVPDAERGQLVGSLVCPEPDCRLEPADLVRQLREIVSTYKVPRVVKVIPYEDLPWLPSGKLSMPGIVELLTDRSDR